MSPTCISTQCCILVQQTKSVTDPGFPAGGGGGGGDFPRAYIKKLSVKTIELEPFGVAPSHSSMQIEQA